MKFYQWILFILLFLLLGFFVVTKLIEFLSLEDGRYDHDWGELLKSSSLNIVFVKVHKVGGSTVAGILRRVSFRYGITPILSTEVDDRATKRLPEPLLVAFHRPARNLLSSLNGLVHPTFRITFLREPADRALSQFYFDWRKKKSPVDREIQLSYLRRINNEQYRYIRPSIFSSVQATFDAYDLVGTRERLDETMVILMHLFNLKISDILYISAKMAIHGDLVKDIPLLPRPTLDDEPASIRLELQSRSWQQQNAKDYQLFHLANQQLDAFIHQIGHDRFLPNLYEYTHHIVQLQNTCRTNQSNYLNIDLCGFESADCDCFDAYIQSFFSILK